MFSVTVVASDPKTPIYLQMLSRRELTDLIIPVLQLALDAGVAIMEVYAGSDFEVEHKDDSSPLTLADRKSHAIIDRGLKDLTPEIPILSEEGRNIPYGERSGWNELWLVDPLDGTKEFIKKNGEFSVNIALIQNGEPVLGVVYAPALSDAYVAVVPQSASHSTGAKQSQDEARFPGPGAWKLHMNGATDASVAPNHCDQEQLLSARPIRCKRREHDRMTIIASRSHMTNATRVFIHEVTRGIHHVQIINIGSALKLCLVADGSADLYPRNASTMEWDTGAGHALVRAAGGEVWQLTQGNGAAASSRRPLCYNKENLLNPHFVARAWG